ncbi:ABC transporter substrate-binding protein [Paenibacillus pinihumi]|uniref:ABC transporter substrate-binding protein n=1 Tax=Paenibacillus pinihumi TaxID=669462 RepID=UPI00048C8525|nr:ABC transporter substrate-binding protein [Paenibacillus pinihumi]
MRRMKSDLTLNFKLRLQPIILLVLISAMLSGCAAGADSGSGGGGSKASGGNGVKEQAATGKEGAEPDLSKVTLRIGQTGWANWELGFREADVDDTPYKIEYSVFQGGNNQLLAIAANQLDLAITSEIPPLFAALAANQGNFKVIAVQRGNTLNQELVIPAGSKVQSVADLKGKKVAYVSNTTAHYFLIKMLEENGLTWEDIDPVQLPTSEGLSALLGGSVDALASYGNSITSAHQRGATELASAKDILSGNFLIEASNDALADAGKKAAIADYLQRLSSFHEWTRKNQERWAKITSEQTHQPYEEALETIREGDKQRPVHLLPISEEAIASLKDVADVLRRVGVLAEDVDIPAIWSNAFDEPLKNLKAP